VARNRAEALIEPLARPVIAWLARADVSPSALTVLSLGLTLPAAVLIAAGRPALGCGLAAFATSLDWLDGQVARRSGRVSRAGNFLDSTLDRWGDLALYGGAALLFRDSLPFLVASLFTMISAVLVSYARAKAESLGVALTIGRMQRTERLALFCGGGLLGPVLDPRLAAWTAGWFAGLPFVVPAHPTLALAIVALAVTTTATAIRRTVGGFRALHGAGEGKGEHVRP
jgi:phosphatidylinositol phosphate synthase